MHPPSTETSGLRFGWNAEGPAFDWAAARVDLNDETLRDGLQCPSVRGLSTGQKLRLLHLRAGLGIASADIGLPGAGPRVREQVLVLGHGPPVRVVTGDTTRATPERLRARYGGAISWGARRLCIADTVGHAVPHGVRRLVRFVKEEIIGPSGEDVKLDWHGHRNRGMGVVNRLAAIEAGVDRVHATALGVGGRVGDAECRALRSSAGA